MKNDYYITQDGELQRKENTVYFTNENTRRAIPVNRVNSIFCYGSVNLTSGVILFLGKKGIPVHFFDYYGWYK
ncbi:MAG: CRISPR-associated endonuclease Cas1, partial [Candidatus Thermoplasmatota archaeon]